MKAAVDALRLLILSTKYHKSTKFASELASLNVRS